MEDSIRRRIQILEDDYLKEKKNFNKVLDEITHEERLFIRNIEEIYVNVKTIVKSVDDVEDTSLSSVNILVNQARDEGGSIVKKAKNKVLSEIEEQDYLYNKQISYYEDEILLIREDN